MLHCSFLCRQYQKNAPCADNSGSGHTTPTAAHKSGIRRLWRRVRTFFCRETLLLQDSQDSSSFLRFASCFARIGTRYENKQEKAEGLHSNPSAGYSGRQRRPQGALYGFCSLKIKRQFRGCGFTGKVRSRDRRNVKIRTALRRKGIQ